MNSTETRPRKVTQVQAVDLIADRIPFDASALSGRWETYAASPGRLPESWRETYRQEMDHGGYVVYSYWTPIAWWTLDHGWTIPPVKYSMTTSTKHQSRLWKIKGA